MEHEGVIKFECAHASDDVPPDALVHFDKLHAWRALFKRLSLIGCDPQRYEGLGFGNLSARVEPKSAQFVATGTQTAQVDPFQPQHLCLVEDYDLREHRVKSRGKVRPSSESLTHAAIYSAAPSARFVFHVHSPEIWNSASRIGIEMTSPFAEYGSEQMSKAAGELAQLPGTRHGGCFAMGGHQDGVIAFGPTAERAGLLIVGLLARSLAFSR